LACGLKVYEFAHLIGHHHTYDQADGPDYQILLEADFLVNAFEDALPKDNIKHFRDQIFRTCTGKELAILFMDLIREMIIPVSKFFIDQMDLNTSNSCVTKVLDGHINATYKVSLPVGNFIFQKIRNMDLEVLAKNYDLVHAAREEAQSRNPVREIYLDGKWDFEPSPCVGIPEFRKCMEGGYFTEDGWRCYLFIEGLPASVCDWDEEKSKKYGESHIEIILGRSLANLHSFLGFVPVREWKNLKAAVPHFHETDYYMSQYEQALASAEDLLLDDKMAHEVESVKADLNRKLSVCISFVREHKDIAALRKKFRNIDVIHGDPKLSNIIVSNEGDFSFLDLDTVMIGNEFLDIADLLRSCLAESMGDEELMYRKYCWILNGYASFSVRNERMIGQSKKSIADAFKLICFELGVRYLMDYISGGDYFPEQYAGQRLDKVMRQFQLIEWQEKEMRLHVFKR